MPDNCSDLEQATHVPGPPVPHPQNEVLVSGTLHKNKRYFAESQCTKRTRAECSGAGEAEQSSASGPCCALPAPRPLWGSLPYKSSF